MGGNMVVLWELRMTGSMVHEKAEILHDTMEDIKGNTEEAVCGP